MTYKQVLDTGQRLLGRAGIGTSRLDSLVLLEDDIGKDRAYILAHPDETITEAELKLYRAHIARRSKQEPLAYIRQKSEFYGRDFYVDKRVLEPRPESEAIIEELGHILQDPAAAANPVVDVGTGSGALIITAKLEHPGIQAYATDISEDCLKVARRNADKYAVGVSFFAGDLLGPLPESAKLNPIIIANLPYVPDLWQINPAAMREPAIAIFGGKDGLRIYARLFGQLVGNKPLYLLTESMPPQHEQLATMAASYGYSLINTNDFVQVFSSEPRPA